MKKLSSVLAEANKKNMIDEINCKSSLSNYIRENLNNINISNLAIINEEFSHTKLARIKDFLKKKDENNEIKSNIGIKQQHTKPLNEDSNLTDFIYLLDCICAFSKISKMYVDYKSDENKENSWFDCEVVKAINETINFVEQLASLVTFLNKDIDIELNFDISSFDNNKQLGSIIKSLDEYKKFRRISKNKFDFSNQKIDIRTLCLVILDKIRKLTTII